MHKELDLKQLLQICNYISLISTSLSKFDGARVTLPNFVALPF